MRNHQPAAGMVLAFTLLCTGSSWARTRSLSLRWGELEAAIGTRPVTVVLTGGVRLMGKVAEVQPRSLRMAVERSSNRKSYPPGEISLPRDEVAEIRIKEVGGPGRLIAAAGAGAAASLGTLGWAISESRVNVSDNRRLVQWSAITAAAVAAGYLAGRQWDSTTTVIRVVASDGAYLPTSASIDSSSLPASAHLP